MKAIINTLTATLTLLTGCAVSTPESTPRFGEKSAISPTLWNIIDVFLRKGLPAKKEEIETILPIRLSEKPASFSYYKTSYVGENLTLANDVDILHVHYVTEKERVSDSPFIRIELFEFTGNCIKEEQLKSRYDALMPDDSVTYVYKKYKIPTHWGGIYFSLDKDAPHCLESIMFDNHRLK
jgi:hypothetical protein